MPIAKPGAANDRQRGHVHHVKIDLTKAQIELYYAGRVKFVVAYDSVGVKLQFPIDHLRRFFAHEGVHGLFVIHRSAGNKLLDIRRL